jgi:hypothetical protein
VLAAARRGGATQARACCRAALLAKLRTFSQHACLLAAQAPIHVAPADSAADAAAHWAALRAAFCADDTALIWHGRNHYALVFALRERSASSAADKATDAGAAAGAAAAPGDGIVRELLTARKGQRPSAWVRWEEARTLMLSWDGHAFIAVTRQRQ